MLSARVGKNKLGYPQNYSLARWYHLRTADHPRAPTQSTYRGRGGESKRGEKKKKGANSKHDHIDH